MPAVTMSAAVWAATPGLHGPLDIPRYQSRNFKPDRQDNTRPVG